ncbi:hypothetical protein PR202_gb19683 [Eleusine coracana subsp. coracana]|uniref:Peptidase A1 domain-containing protein n=1 Tax=Eleusine coracana subsp. coracana TaxID=191504 RepID=A0AAV5F8W0_ELECO|nr:hypothetical protein QOZ80_3BG0282010 [Eleusine coracana subsp. coracana]GJN31301.1 hypothetical protein PR202_gb19683 [Eleusine coracana subsp. coracana]
MAEMHKLSFLLLALLVAQLAITCSDATTPVRMHLTRTHSGSGLTRRETLRRMALRSKARAAASGQVVPGKGDPNTEYRVKLAVGTPPQPVELTLDTGSDLIWTQCQLGSSCPSCYDQPLPYFDPSRSSTVSKLDCGSPACQDLDLSSCGTRKSHWGNQTCVYTYWYGDKSVTTGFLGADTFTFAGAAAGLPGVAFGCGLFNNGILTFNGTGMGIVGFGRGSLSLPSQLKVDNFSYCFTPETGSKPSPVLLGLPANLYSSSARGVAQTTRLIQNPNIPTFYYLSLKGIAVGSTRLAIPDSTFTLTKDGTGGTIIDSGTAITTLPPHVYRLLRDAFVSQVKLKANDDGLLCFEVPARAKKLPRMPRLALHFEGATLELPRENYVIDVDEGTGRREMCIVITEGGDETTIIGNYQQQNLHILYDLAGNKLSFVPARCDRV